MHYYQPPLPKSKDPTFSPSKTVILELKVLSATAEESMQNSFEGQSKKDPTVAKTSCWISKKVRKELLVSFQLAYYQCEESDFANYLTSNNNMVSTCTLCLK